MKVYVEEGAILVGYNQSQGCLYGELRILLLSNS